MTQGSVWPSDASFRSPTEYWSRSKARRHAVISPRSVRDDEVIRPPTITDRHGVQALYGIFSGIRRFIVVPAGTPGPIPGVI